MWDVFATSARPAVVFAGVSLSPEVPERRKQCCDVAPSSHLRVGGTGDGVIRGRASDAPVHCWIFAGK